MVKIINISKNKKTLTFILALITAFISITYVYAEIIIPKRTKEFYVNDFVYVLSDNTKDFIFSVNKNFKNTPEKPQIVVTTVRTLDGNNLEEYSAKMFEKYKIGKSEKKRNFNIISHSW